MALINCPECNKEISDKATTCPHCGCPLEAQSTPAKKPKESAVSMSPQRAVTKATNPSPKKSTNRPVWLFVVLPLVFLTGCLVYLKFVRPHPVITLCESVIIRNLKSPSSYRPLSREMIIAEEKYGLKSEASVLIEYEAANAFNAKIKNHCVCIMGELALKPNDWELYSFQKLSSLGKSPFNSLYIVKILIENNEVEVPLSVKIHNVEPNIFTPAAPGYVTNWVGDGPTDYIVRESLDEEIIQKNREAIEQKMRAEAEATKQKRIAEVRVKEEAKKKRIAEAEVAEQKRIATPVYLKLAKLMPRPSELVKQIDAPTSIQPDNTSSVVVFFRPEASFGIGLFYFVSQNGQNIGGLWSGSYFAFKTDPGEHIFTIPPISSVSENEIKIQAKANETIYIMISTVEGPIWLFGSPGALPELALSTYEKFEGIEAELAYTELTEEGRAYKY